MLEVRPFPVPHDAREPVQFVVGDGARRLGVLTDIGVTTRYVEASLTGCDALVLECNHDLDMLASGDYPFSLKQRIAGRLGHLHNEAAGRAARARSTRRGSSTSSPRIFRRRTTRRTRRARRSRGALNCTPDWIGIADQDDGFGWRELCMRSTRGTDSNGEDSMEKRQELYRGKAKTVYATDDPQRLVMHYRDDVSAFDGAKLAQARRQGRDEQPDQRVRHGQARRRRDCRRISCRC